MLAILKPRNRHSLGDPIEIAGLCQSLAAHLTPVLAGSAKSNIGHCEAAALQDWVVPAAMANKTLSRACTPVRQIQISIFQIRLLQLRKNGNRGWCLKKLRVAGLAHLVPAAPMPMLLSKNICRSATDRVFSSHQHSSLHQRSLLNQSSSIIAASSAKMLSLKTSPKTTRLYWPENVHIRLADIAFTLQMGREHFAERLAVVVSSFAELREQLDQLFTVTKRKLCYRRQSVVAICCGSTVQIVH